MSDEQQSGPTQNESEATKDIDELRARLAKLEQEAADIQCNYQQKRRKWEEVISEVPHKIEQAQQRANREMQRVASEHKRQAIHLQTQIKESRMAISTVRTTKANIGQPQPDVEANLESNLSIFRQQLENLRNHNQEMRKGLQKNSTEYTRLLHQNHREIGRSLQAFVDELSAKKLEGRTLEAERNGELQALRLAVEKTEEEVHNGESQFPERTRPILEENANLESRLRKLSSKGEEMKKRADNRVIAAQKKASGRLAKLKRQLEEMLAGKVNKLDCLKDSFNALGDGTVDDDCLQKRMVKLRHIYENAADKAEKGREEEQENVSRVLAEVEKAYGESETKLTKRAETLAKSENDLRLHFEPLLEDLRRQKEELGGSQADVPDISDYSELFQKMGGLMGEIEQQKYRARTFRRLENIQGSRNKDVSFDKVLETLEPVVAKKRELIQALKHALRQAGESVKKSSAANLEEDADPLKQQLRRWNYKVHKTRCAVEAIERKLSEEREKYDKPINDLEALIAAEKRAVEQEKHTLWQDVEKANSTFQKTLEQVKAKSQRQMSRSHRESLQKRAPEKEPPKPQQFVRKCDVDPSRRLKDMDALEDGIREVKQELQDLEQEFVRTENSSS